VLLRIQRGTRADFERLKGVLAAYPGDFEVQVLILPEGTYDVLFLPYSVTPSMKFLDAVKKAMPQAKMDIFGNFDEAEAFEDHVLSGDDGLERELAPAV
jgi:hypothetical protein